MAGGKSKDRRLVEEYVRAQRAATVTRHCLCCGATFETTEAYRLCETHRAVEIVCRGSVVGALEETSI